MARVVVLGGYGVFGSRIVRSLARHAELEVMVAGRSGRAAARFCAELGAPRVSPAAVDCRAADGLERLLALHPTVVIDAVGPFHQRSHVLPRGCAAAGIHCVDIADNRRHVGAIGELHSLARDSDALIVSGASTVPALSTAVVDELSRGLSRLLSIDVGISPGHRAPRGLATVQSILSYCGLRIPAFSAGRPTTEYGWGGLHRQRYPAPVGARWLSNVDVPEREIWPTRYRGLQSLRVAAGLEVGVLHLALTTASTLVRLGALRSLVPHARSMMRVADAFDSLASDAGAMHVQVVGENEQEQLLRRTWIVVAERGDGPQIPATPSAVLVKKLLGIDGYAALTTRGASPCVGLLSLDEIIAELAGYAIRTELHEEQVPVRG